ncbi:MAG: hypothetical protein DYG89_52935 [Caldilinea sp. CFX5]|nr:hypothetical protein [Caldilinea sp. CFX5]
MNFTILRAPSLTTPLPAADLFEQLTDTLGAHTLPMAAGTHLCSPDRAATMVYVVRKGVIEVRNATGLLLQTLTTGAWVGALEVWTGRDWGLAVTAATASEVIAIDAAIFRNLMRINLALRQAAGAAATALMQQTQLATVLTRCLGPLDSVLFQQVATAVHWRQLADGEFLLRQGEADDALFLVVSGRLQQHYHADDGIEHPAGQLVPGETVGHFLETAPHTVTVRAVRESTVVEFPLALCRQLWQEYPHALLPFLRHGARQQQSILTALTAKPLPPTTLALIPATADIDLVEFTYRLATAMQRYGAVLTLTREQVDLHFGQKRVADLASGHPLHPFLIDWLNEQETNHRYLLYVGDATWSAWTRRCLGQADRILVIANAAAAPEPTLVEQAIYALSPQAPLELVLLHEPTVEQPSGTHHWLEKRPVTGHYHLRRHDAAQMASLARRLTGNAIGLVLSGGGARGIAHLGLLQALEELQLPWDWIGSTSMGALIGIGFALAMPYERALAQTAALSNPKALFDYTLPLVSLLASDKVTAIIRAIVGEQRIEDLWRPYFAVATDLSAAELVVQECGPLWRAVRASLSIPGIFAPVIDERGHLLVDGGIMNNFPVDLMRARIGNGQIIGVNVGQVADADPRYAYDAGLSGWQVLRSRLDPWAESIAAPSLPEILIRSLMVNNQRWLQQTKQLCDLLIEPAVQRFGLLQFTEYAAIAELGYGAAHPALAAWKARHFNPLRSVVDKAVA